MFGKLGKKMGDAFNIDDVAEEIKNDPKLRENFLKDPVKTVEKTIGVDLPDEQIQAIINKVRAKIDGEEAV